MILHVSILVVAWCGAARGRTVRCAGGTPGATVEASKPHPVTQQVVLDACTGQATGMHESTGPSCRLLALLGGSDGPGEK